MRSRLFAVGLAAFGLTTRLSAAEFSWPPPPKPPSCPAKGVCDRDPEHLTAYVSAFYEWEVLSRAGLNKAFPSLSSGVNSKARDAAFAAENRYLQGALTKTFYRLYEKQMSAYDGDNSSPFCRDHDASALTCNVQFADAWLSDVRSSATEIGATKATLKVELPKFSYAEEPGAKAQEGAANTLSVTLVVDKGVWKFDHATDLGPHP